MAPNEWPQIPIPEQADSRPRLSEKQISDFKDFCESQWVCRATEKEIDSYEAVMSWVDGNQDRKGIFSIADIDSMGPIVGALTQGWERREQVLSHAPNLASISHSDLQRLDVLLQQARIAEERDRQIIWQVIAGAVSIQALPVAVKAMLPTDDGPSDMLWKAAVGIWTAASVYGTINNAHDRQSKVESRI